MAGMAGQVVHVTEFDMRYNQQFLSIQPRRFIVNRCGKAVFLFQPMQEINPIKYKIADLRERTESLRGYL
jgi:hypothetical protein